MFPSEKLFPYSFTSRIYKPGTFFAYLTYTVGEADKETPYALIIIQDGRHDEIAEVSKRLYEEGKAPAALIVGIHCGYRTTADGEVRFCRSEEYDALDPSYGDFLINEFIPHVIEQTGLPVSDDPDRHLIAGGSSGAICSLIAGWFHPEYFRRFYLNSPAFLSFGKGHELTTLLRLSETKPFRIAMEYSENEPNVYFGDLRLAAQQAESAFLYSGYEYQSRYFPGEDHCSRFHCIETLYDVFAFLWRDYKTKPVAPLHQQPRTEDIFAPGDGWIPRAAMPEERPETGGIGTYRVSDNRILFTPTGGTERVVAEGNFAELRQVAFSAHQKLLYVADAGRDCLYEYTIGTDGSLSDRYRHGILPIRADFIKPGAYSLCVDDVDRIYAATELGIQCVTSWNEVEAILELPDCRTPVVKIAFGGEDGRELYAETVDGRVYSRRLKHAGRCTVTEVPEDYSSRFVY